jgi:hypothetical protein
MSDVPEELRDFVSPGRIENPFAKPTSSTLRDSGTLPPTTAPFGGVTRQMIPPKGPRQGVDITNRSMQVERGPVPNKRLFGRQFAWPCYVAPATDAILARALEANVVTTDDVPFIMRVSQLIAQTMRRETPSTTDVETAIVFRSEEQIEQISSGEYEVKIARNSSKSSDAMSPKQLRMYWINTAKAVLAKLRDTTETPASTS